MGVLEDKEKMPTCASLFPAGLHMPYQGDFLRDRDGMQVDSYNCVSLRKSTGHLPSLCSVSKYPASVVRAWVPLGDVQW